MPRKRARQGTDTAVLSYLHDSARKHIPPAGLAAQGKMREAPRLHFSYDPHLPPALRSDPTGAADRLQALLESARTRSLSAEEVQYLAEALQHHEPWLEWAGKCEKQEFSIESVALHIHERVAAQTIVKIAAREDVQRSLFADPQLDYRQAVQFYQHDMDWANRLILGDSLHVMASLVQRENLAGKVQMIYMDPPYGIKFASNFQPEIGRRDVKDRESDLTREPEMVKAYRDTWTLGVHSYLAYLRDRLRLCRELLADTGSIFVQISDENLHRVRCVMDEVFKPENFVAVIAFSKTGGFSATLLDSVADYVLWYAKDKTQTKYHQLYGNKEPGEEGGTKYTYIESSDGARRTMTPEEIERPSLLPDGTRVLRVDTLVSQGFVASASVPYSFEGKAYSIGSNLHWKTTLEGLHRLVVAQRIVKTSNTLGYMCYLHDFPVFPLHNVWTDIGGIQNRRDPKVYVAQTATKAIERCLLMTTRDRSRWRQLCPSRSPWMAIRRSVANRRNWRPLMGEWRG